MASFLTNNLELYLPPHAMPLYVEAVADGVQYAKGYDDVNEAAILGSWGVKATVVNGQLTGVAMPD